MCYLGSIVIIDDSRRCSTESRLLNIQRSNPKAVILHSSSGLIPHISSGAPVSIPVLAIGPEGYKKLKREGFIKKVSIYRPTKSIFDPSILLLFFIAIATYSVGGMISGKRTIRALARSAKGVKWIFSIVVNIKWCIFSTQETSATQAAMPMIHSAFLPGSPSFPVFTTSGPSRPVPRLPDDISPAIGGGTEALATAPVTLPMVFQMVVFMAIFLTMMYILSSRSLRTALDFYMYFILTPSILAEFFEPLFKVFIPWEYIRVPLLYTITVGVTVFWVKHM